MLCPCRMYYLGYTSSQFINAFFLNIFCFLAETFQKPCFSSLSTLFFNSKLYKGLRCYISIGPIWSGRLRLQEENSGKLHSITISIGIQSVWKSHRIHHLYRTFQHIIVCSSLYIGPSLSHVVPASHLKARFGQSRHWFCHSSLISIVLYCNLSLRTRKQKTGF